MEEVSKYIINNSGTVEAIVNRLNNDIDYIPTYEEYLLVSDMNLLVGESPIYTLELVNHNDATKLNKIEKSTLNSRPVGMKELFCSLESDKSCSSYSESRIYYMAYLLACENILVNISGQEYRNKQLKKVKVLQGYQNTVRNEVNKYESKI